MQAPNDGARGKGTDDCATGTGMGNSAKGSIGTDNNQQSWRYWNQQQQWQGMLVPWVVMAAGNGNIDEDIGLLAAVVEEIAQW